MNAAIYSALSEEEIIWLGNMHNKQQHKTLQMGAREYVSIICRNYTNRYNYRTHECENLVGIQLLPTTTPK